MKKAFYSVPANNFYFYIFQTNYEYLILMLMAIDFECVSELQSASRLNAPRHRVIVGRTTGKKRDEILQFVNLDPWLLTLGGTPPPGALETKVRLRRTLWFNPVATYQPAEMLHVVTQTSLAVRNIAGINTHIIVG